MSEYDILLKEAKKEVESTQRSTAHRYIPKMYRALRTGDPVLTAQGARDRIERDCARIWSYRTILDALPDEAKNDEKQKASRLRKKKVKSAAVSAAQSEKQDIIMVDARGNTSTEDLPAPPPARRSDQPGTGTAYETNLKSSVEEPIDFEFSLKFKDVQRYMAKLYSMIGDIGTVWFSGTIDRNTRVVTNARPGKIKEDPSTIDKISSNYYDDNLDDNDITI